jgi:8-oxo-dGTP diphosphatase
MDPDRRLDAPGRDPRLNVVTVAYRAALPAVGDLVADTDARAVRVWPVESILVGELSLAFDHDRILRDAVERARIELCPPHWTAERAAILASMRT